MILAMPFGSPLLHHFALPGGFLNDEFCI